MKISKRQLRRIIKEINWFGLADQVDALNDDQKEVLGELTETLNDALEMGIPPETIRETIKARMG